LLSFANDGFCYAIDGKGGGYYIKGFPAK